MLCGLRQYGEFSEEVAQLVLQRVAASGTSRWFPNTTVDSLQLHDSSAGCPISISAQTADGAQVSVSAKSVLLATGGRPKMPSMSAHLNAKLRSSDYIQREVGMAEVKSLMEAKGGQVSIAVIGGSHSAFSGSQLMLNMLGTGVKVEILHRDTIRVYYDSVSDAEAAGYEVNPASVCAVSGQVNRCAQLGSIPRAPCDTIRSRHLLDSWVRLRVGMVGSARRSGSCIRR